MGDHNAQVVTLSAHRHKLHLRSCTTCVFVHRVPHIVSCRSTSCAYAISIYIYSLSHLCHILWWEIEVTEANASGGGFITIEGLAW